jgi:menaquinone-9 beta-reductase
MSFDLITVGGGLAGSTLATELARVGHKVLVLERETHFKDRVRGENMLPWGVAAAHRLGLVDYLLANGGHQPPYWAPIWAALRFPAVICMQRRRMAKSR